MGKYSRRKEVEMGGSETAAHTASQQSTDMSSSQANKLGDPALTDILQAIISSREEIGRASCREKSVGYSIDRGGRRRLKKKI